MSGDLAQSVRDAIALTTLLADAVESGGGWEESLMFARGRLAEHQENLVMAQAHLLVQALGALRDLVNELPEDVEVMDVERPVTVLSLLAQFGASAASEGD
ncbi:hypothetical protein ACI784_15235 [Geodermatophilus sp. SYSU D01186]